LVPVDPGVLEELQPLAEVHPAELPADEPDLVVAALAVLVLLGLHEAHGEPRERVEGRAAGTTDYRRLYGRRKRRASGWPARFSVAGAGRRLRLALGSARAGGRTRLRPWTADGRAITLRHNARPGPRS